MHPTWFDLASDARKAASRLASEHYRSCLNRAYYSIAAEIGAQSSSLRHAGSLHHNRNAI